MIITDVARILLNHLVIFMVVAVRLYSSQMSTLKTQKAASAVDWVMYAIAEKVLIAGVDEVLYLSAQHS